MRNLVLIAATIIGFAAHAATTGTISLSGSIGSVNDISITQYDIATSLDIAQGESAALVATVTESSNSPTGYTIFMNSVNNSNLVNTSDSTQNTAYLVSYDGGTPVSLGTTDMAVKTIGPLTSLFTDQSDVFLTVTGNPAAASGEYTDVITVSIAAN